MHDHSWGWNCPSLVPIPWPLPCSQCVFFSLFGVHSCLCPCGRLSALVPVLVLYLSSLFLLDCGFRPPPSTAHHLFLSLTPYPCPSTLTHLSFPFCHSTLLVPGSLYWASFLHHHISMILLYTSVALAPPAVQILQDSLRGGSQVRNVPSPLFSQQSSLPPGRRLLDLRLSCHLQELRVSLLGTPTLG